jgi:hypothetical protein
MNSLKEMTVFRGFQTIEEFRSMQEVAVLQVVWKITLQYFLNGGLYATR